MRRGARPAPAFEGRWITPARIAALWDAGVRVTAEDGFLRLSPSIFNTEEEIEMVADRLRSLIVRPTA